MTPTQSSERAEVAALFGHDAPKSLTDVAAAYLAIRQRLDQAEVDVRAARADCQDAEKDLLASLSAHEQTRVTVGDALISASSLTSYRPVPGGLDNAHLLRWISRHGGWELLKTTLDAHGFSALCREIVAAGGELPYLVQSYKRTVIQVRGKT